MGMGQRPSPTLLTGDKSQSAQTLTPPPAPALLGAGRTSPRPQRELVRRSASTGDQDGTPAQEETFASRQNPEFVLEQQDNVTTKRLETNGADTEPSVPSASASGSVSAASLPGPTGTDKELRPPSTANVDENAPIIKLFREEEEQKQAKNQETRARDFDVSAVKLGTRPRAKPDDLAPEELPPSPALLGVGSTEAADMDTKGEAAAQRLEALKDTAAHAKDNSNGETHTAPRVTDADARQHLAAGGGAESSAAPLPEKENAAERAHGSAERGADSHGVARRSAVPANAGGGLARREALLALLAVAFGFLWGTDDDGGDAELVQQTVKQEETQILAELNDIKARLAAAATEGGGFGWEGDDDAPEKKEELGPLMEAALAAAVSGILYVQGSFLKTEYEGVKKSYMREGSRFTWKEVVGYRLDDYLSNYPLAKPLLLLNSTFLIILFGSIVLAVTQGQGVANALWTSWTFVADPGTQVNAESPSLRAVAFGITVTGLVVFALMIGIITESVAEQVEEFKKGRSRVLERDHVLMLGWSQKSLSIISQLACAGESEGGTSIVVLAECPKEEMELQLKTAIMAEENPLRLLGSQVVFRCGDTLLESELYKVGVTRAKSVIALSRSDLMSDEADSSMLRQVLSLKGALAGAANLPRITIELQDVDNSVKIQLANPEAEIVCTHDVIGQLMVSCSRQPGLAFVLEHILSFEGSEVYFKEWPGMHGWRFREALCAFEDAVVLGVKMDAVGGGPPLTILNPSDDYIIKPGDEIIVLAEDDDSYEPKLETVYRERLSEDGRKMREAIQTARRQQNYDAQRSQSKRAMLKKFATGTLKSIRDTVTLRRSAADDVWSGAVGDGGTGGGGELENPTAPERVLFVGWRRDMADMIMSLDMLVHPGSELWLFNSVPVQDRVEKLRDGGNKGALSLENLEIKHALGNPTIRREMLEMASLDEFGDVTGETVSLLDFDSTLLLADESGSTEDVLSTDGRSLASFLLVTDVRKDIIQAQTQQLSRQEKKERSMKQAEQRRRKRRNKDLEGEATAPADPAPAAQEDNLMPVDHGRDRIICEILDDTNTKSLLSSVDCTGYVLSHRIVSNYIAQVAENPLLNKLFKEWH